jgi:butyryl-CoA dehydrogenase
VDGEKFSSFIVERGYPGVSTGPEEKKMGLKGSSTRALILDNVPVPVENLLGEVGRGHVVAFNILNIGRFKLAAGCLGASRRAFHNALTYARQRRAFGKAIAEFGLIQEKLAEMATRLFAGESIVYRTAGLLDALLAQAGPESPDYAAHTWKVMEEYAVECSINKVYLSEILAHATDECVQIYGGYGYHQDYPAERAYRDARIQRIFEGTNEINRLVITNLLMKRAQSGRLPLMPAAARALQEFLASPPAAPRQESPAMLAEESRLVTAAKKAALALAATAYTKFQGQLAEQQEIIAAISDIVMEVFAMESAVLRAQKIAALIGKDRAAHAARMARLFVHTRLSSAEQRARTALAAIASDDTLRAHLKALDTLLRRDAVDIIALRRQIAAHVSAQGRYVV